MWSFVDNKGNKQWVWLAIDAKTREIAGAFIGERSQAGAKDIWQSLPAVYRQCAVCWKESGKTNYIERFNCTLRQRISRLVRKT